MQMMRCFSANTRRMDKSQDELMDTTQGMDGIQRSLIIVIGNDTMVEQEPTKLQHQHEQNTTNKHCDKLADS